MISVASSIKFRKQDGLLASFDNTMHEDENHFRVSKHPYYQTFFTVDTAVKVQAEVLLTESLEMQYSVGTFRAPGVVTWGEFQTMTGETLVFTGATFRYYEKTLDMSAYTSGYVKFKAIIMESETVVETWLSEPCEVITADYDRYLQIEYFMYDQNAFNCYYVNPTEADRLSQLIRVKGQCRKYKPSGETDVFDNQNEVVKIKAVLKRTFTLETDAIPAYMCEKIAAALAHDKFFINEVEFVAEKEPDYDLSNADVASLTCQLTQRDIPGLNAHDTGYDCDTAINSDMTHLHGETVSGQTSFVVPAGYLIAWMTCYRIAGDPVITAGTTPGGTNIVNNMVLNGTTKVWSTSHIGREIAPTVDATLYLNVAGAGATADIDILLINNRQ